MSPALYSLPQIYRRLEFLISLGISADLLLSSPCIFWGRQVRNRASLRPCLNFMYQPSYPAARKQPRFGKGLLTYELLHRRRG